MSSAELVDTPVAPGRPKSADLSETPITSARLGVAVVGCGYWGPNLIRNFAVCPASEVVTLCDQDRGRLEKSAAPCPRAALVEEFRQVLADPRVEAVVIATPVGTHFRLATAALEAGKHVLVEKPLATSVREAESLVRLADTRGLTLMVDHTFIYSPSIRKIKELVDQGALGDIYHIDSVRINLGLIQNDVNVLWDLAPHDLSIVDFLLGNLPRSVAAMGSCHTGADLEDVAYLNLDFGRNLLASFHVNWLSPVKIRHLIISGSKKSLVYNDLNAWEPIKVYDRGIQIDESPEARRGVLVSYRTGDVWSPHIEQSEPLQNVVQHFTDCIRTGSKPLTDGAAGLRVVRILEAAQRSIKAQGGRITL
jgi:predicted dehydrogenase